MATNQNSDNQPLNNNNQEIVSTLEETIKSLQLFVEQINRGENQYLPDNQLISNFLTSSNQLVNSGAVANDDVLKFNQDKTQTDSWLDDEDSYSPNKKITTKKTKKLFQLNTKTIVIILLIFITIIGIFWLILKPDLSRTENQNTESKIVVDKPRSEQNIVDDDNFQAKENITIPTDKIEPNIITKETDTITKNEGLKDQLKSSNIEINKNNNSEEESTFKNNDDGVKKENSNQIFLTPFTIEKTLIENIEKEINQITQKYGEKLILNIKANFSKNYLQVTLSQDWYNITNNQQDNLVEDIFKEGKKLDFDKFNFQDTNGILLARNAFIGDKIIITAR